uniref:Uncharacterized protein n=1 Tax=Acanthochromis polyacanthus TaxID=80966 RepID=A0A3Q1GKK6_9TELE
MNYSATNRGRAHLPVKVQTMADDGRRGDEEDRGPGAAHQVFVVMECLLEKLKMLNYEEEVLAIHNMKNISR